MDLVEFLRARLDEDEAAARRAKPGPWTQDGGSIYAGHPTEEVVDWVYDDSWEHIARHDPARVLAEVEAKRRIVELADEASGLDAVVDGEFRVGSRDPVAEPYIGDLILRHLAAPYAGHPDYDARWRP